MQVNKLVLMLLDNDCAENDLDIDRDEQSRLNARRCSEISADNKDGSDESGSSHESQDVHTEEG